MPKSNACADKIHGACPRIVTDPFDPLEQFECVCVCHGTPAAPLDRMTPARPRDTLTPGQARPRPGHGDSCPCQMCTGRRSTQLLARVAALHTNDDGACRTCGTTWPCPTDRELNR
jgi:hypothetical protein